MSRRTAEANRAIAEAWKYEQQLVKQGTGTRDWTPEQQQDILEKGRAYDDDGKAFEGHHMKSVETFPEYQGDHNNIQFLSRPEHFSAHNGNFQNPTNGYYNPDTGLTKDFGSNDYEPCEVKKLSNPVLKETETADNLLSDNQERSGERKTDSDSASKKENISEIGNAGYSACIADTATKVNFQNSIESGNGFKQFFLGIGKHISGIGRFIINHHKEIMAISSVIYTVVETANRIIDRHSSDNSETNCNDSYGYSSNALMDDEDEDNDDTGESNTDDNENTEKRDRASPREHSVSGYDRIQNGKKVHVNSYTRGKNREN